MLNGFKTRSHLPSLILKILNFQMAIEVQNANNIHQYTKLHQNRLNGFGDTAIF